MSTDIAPIFKFSKTLAAATDDLIEAWLAGRNAKTRRGYLSDLGRFALWAKAPSDHAVVDSLLRLKPGDANRIVLAYRAHMVETGLSSSTINRRLAALRSMVKVGRTIGKITWSLDVENIRSEVRRDMQGPGLADLQLMTRAAASMGDRKPAHETGQSWPCSSTLACGAPSYAALTWPMSRQARTDCRRPCGSSARVTGKNSG